MKKIRYFFLWALFIIVFEFCTGFIRGYILIKIDNVAMLVKYFILTLIVLRKWKDEFIPYFAALHLLCGIFLFAALYGYITNDRVGISAWTNLIMALTGGWSALLFYRSKRIRTKVAIAGFGLSILSVLMYN